MMYVRPVEVEALRARLSPAFEAIGVRPGRAVALAARWRAFCSEPCGWVNAYDLLQAGRDLEAELSLVEAPGARPVASRPTPTRRETVGTFLGDPTVAELEDLIAAERAQLEALDKARGCPAWAAADPAGYGKWAADVFDASAKMREWIDRAESIGMLGVPDWAKSTTPAGIYWGKILDAAKPFVDLVRRYNAAGFCEWPHVAVPQPRASSDADMHALLWATDTTKKIEDTAEKVRDTGESALKWVGAAAVGGLLLLLLSRGGGR